MLYSSESISAHGSDFVFRMNVSYFHSQSEKDNLLRGAEANIIFPQFIHYWLAVLSISLTKYVRRD